MSNPQLSGSDGESLTPREPEPMELRVSDETDDEDSDEEVSEAEDNAEAVESKPDRIPHQLFYPLMVALWILTALIGMAYFPSTHDVYGVDPNRFIRPTMMVVGCGLVSLLIYVPAALFDKLFPTSTRLSMTQTYTKALDVAVNFVGKIVGTGPRRIY